MSKITNSSSLTSKYTMPDYSTQSYNTTSNESTTEYMTDAFVKERTSEKSRAVPNQEIRQTLTLTNNSDYDIENIRIIDTIGTGATIKDGSLIVDSVEKPTLDITSGITLENPITKNGGKAVIEYTIVVDSNPTVKLLSTVSHITYDVNEITNLKEQSNTTTIDIINEKLTIIKSANVLAVVSGQNITFTNIVKNEGNIKNTDIMFYDPIPDGTSFVENSVEINGAAKEGLNPATGFALDDLDAGQSHTVTFQVLVN